jgi:hypothetical protein
MRHPRSVLVMAPALVLVLFTTRASAERVATIGRNTAGAWQAPGDTAGKDKKKGFGSFTEGTGFRLADTEHGDLNVKLYAYIRYLNQLGLDDSYTDGFGTEKSVRRRQDIQFQKVNIQFLGWLLSPKFRYLAYVWTTNSSQGLGAQVVVGGNLHYRFNKHVTAGGGIGPVPTTRSTEGNFPYWLTVDNRIMADEFFRGSYTMGIWAKGAVVDRLTYYAMLGNNLSQLGVDAGQLDNKLDTWALTLAWRPTTGEFGKNEGFGDYEQHQRLATRIGGHYTHSTENRQSQPGTDDPDNSQIRLSDGNVIFTPGLFGPGISVNEVTYHMASADIGAKYHGLSLEVEYYWRLVNNLSGGNTGGLGEFRDHGFALLASAMVVPKLVQVYASGSKIYGEYGNPSEYRLGVTWYPFKSQVIRWNAQWIQLDHTPVGSNSLPVVVGGNGPVFHTDFEVNF